MGGVGLCSADGEHVAAANGGCCFPSGREAESLPGGTMLAGEGSGDVAGPAGEATRLDGSAYKKGRSPPWVRITSSRSVQRQSGVWWAL